MEATYIFTDKSGTERSGAPLYDGILYTAIKKGTRESKFYATIWDNPNEESKGRDTV